MPKELIGSHEVDQNQDRKVQIEEELEHLREYILNIERIQGQMNLSLSREKMEKWDEAAKDAIAELSERRKQLEKDLEALS